jgi:hypothetical protein
MPELEINYLLFTVYYLLFTTHRIIILSKLQRRFNLSFFVTYCWQDLNNLAANSLPCFEAHFSRGNTQTDSLRKSKIRITSLPFVK